MGRTKKLGRKAKSLLRWLKYCQLHCLSISSPILYLIKYTLRHKQKCRTVVLDYADDDEPLSPETDRISLPTFIYTQLQAQNITNDYVLVEQVQPLLRFVQSVLPKPGHQGTHPTLFGYYCPEKHRTFWFFAFVEIKMGSRIYSARELLNLRHTPLDGEVADHLRLKRKSDSDLDGVILIPLGPILCGKPLSRIKEEPKKEEDSSVLKEKDPCLAKGKGADRVAAPQLDGTDSEWKYGGRSDSEHTETHPISAPPGLAAQKAEGFQKFYKAVVSPTHVRVTAGGRIVPNSRGSMSPNTKWARERPLGDASAGVHPAAVAHQVIPPYSMQHHQYGPFIPTMNGLPPGMQPGMAPGPVPYSIMPVPMGYNMAGSYAMPPPMFNHAQPTKSAMNQSNGSSQSDKQSEGSAPDKQKPVRISPPEQFDHSRPFYYNGHWMMPNSQPFYPYGMMPPEGFQPATIAGSMILPSDQNGVNQMAQNGVNSMVQNGINGINPMIQNEVNTVAHHAVHPTVQPGLNPMIHNGVNAMAQNGSNLMARNGVNGTNSMVQNGVNGTNPTVQNGTNPGAQTGVNHMAQTAKPSQHVEDAQPAQPVRPRVAPPATSESKKIHHIQTPPPVSSIRPSDITRKQIDGLRANMRYFEDQLQYNKHQIDEKYTKKQVEMIRGQIQNFEMNLSDQLRKEVFYYPSPNIGNCTQPTNSSRGGSESTGSRIRSDDELELTQSAKQELIDAAAKKAARGKGRARATPSLNSAKTSSATFQAVQMRAEISLRDSKKASSLPVGAALAPPFQPRAPSTSTLATAIHAPQSTASGPDDEFHPSNDHLIPAGGSGWRSFFKNSRSVIDLGGPYLLGKVPRGMKPEDVTSADYVYGRKLTKDEKRARHMYWGKTPRNLQKGLPKFDGKDFYPPSPHKGSSSDSSDESLSPTSAADLDSEPLDYEPQQLEHNDPFQGMSSSGRANIRNRLGDATQSEALPPLGDFCNYGAEIRRSTSCATQVSEITRQYPGALPQDSLPSTSPSLKNSGEIAKDGCNDGSKSSCKGGSKGKSTPSDSDEDSPLTWQGRQGMVQKGTSSRKSGNPMLTSLMKKGKSSANVAPGKVSPTTAQGVLPNYAGHAAASLTPTIANTTPTLRGQFTKIGETNNIRSSTEKRAENRPPVDHRLDELRRGTSHQGNGYRNMDSR
ncbi:hypothetical protein EDB81DRAFT_934383 [Dactylonectria macrodidyma]|uniref:Uncharacterized protein n=1 Tax=Dactylonectria macrodidyma TaxID=307937 RepID=A0A9P9EXN7_9HYPO|nr:hypothetical protein EDB81DRAFT_934383 [Dactylonectria macrodidyma]